MSTGLSKKIFGLDISDRAIRLTVLKKKGRRILVESFNEQPVPPDILVNGEIEAPEKLAELIKNLVKTAKGKKISAKNVISVLPETKTFIKVISVPYLATDTDEKKLDQLIKTEIVNHIPLSPDEIYLDWQILDRLPNSTQLLIGAAPKTIVDSYANVLEKSNLQPYVLEIEAAAITRCLIPEKTDGAKIIIDFGAVRTGLIVYDHHTIQFTVTLPVSGNKITESIAKTLNLDLEKAEEAKIICGLDPARCEGALLKILMKTIDSLVVQIKKSIMFYDSNFSGGNIVSEILLCGGGANFLNIEKILGEKLNLPVRIADPLADAFAISWKDGTRAKALSYTTAIGLALRALVYTDII